MKQKHIKREKRTSAVKQQQQKSREKKLYAKCGTFSENYSLFTIFLHFLNDKIAIIIGIMVG